MTDKKPNNNDIIKALNICSKSTNGCSHSKYTCEDCYLNGQPMCSSALLQDAIDLNTRQQAEIDSLRADLKRACAEIDDAKICKYSFIASSSILDFAERLRRNAVGLKLANRDYRFVSVKEIDSLVIKMSGETHEW